jgi:hypothetical protein
MLKSAPCIAASRNPKIRASPQSLRSARRPASVDPWGCAVSG